MKESLLVATFILLILTGCAYRPIPVAAAYPITAQRKMQSAHHWDVLAKDLADRLKKTIDISFPNAVVKPPLFIKLTEKQEKIPFTKAFFNLLTSRLVQQGLIVMDSNAQFGDNLVIEYHVQVIQHKDRRLTYPPPGILTALGASVWMVDQAIRHWAYPELSAIPFLLAGDLNSIVEYYLPGETNTEIVITTAVTMGQQYIFGDSRMYYVNDGDYDHYENPNKTYQVVNQ
ncbi:MAG: hypothetical protein DRQ41_08340 [Gammaproteobacteria bacterium]|nr:MAG: hypothetical protein DRQ41_08340 [Gammaproteobacteria bacterium]